MNIRLKNDLMHSIHNYEQRRSKWPTLGRKRKMNSAQVLDRILYVCRTGCQWSQLPVEGASYKTVYHYFALWSKARLFENVFYAFANIASSTGRGALVLDTSFVKNVHGSDVIGPNPTDRGRKGSKLSLLTDSKGTPLCAVLHKANKNDALTLKHTLETFKRKVSSHDKFSSLLADKGYDASHCRTVCEQHKLMPCIPRRRTKDIFPGRYVVEQTFGLLDQFRRVRVRYETLSRNFKSMHFLALSVIVARRLT